MSLSLVIGAILHQTRVEASACRARNFVMRDVRASQQRIGLHLPFAFRAAGLDTPILMRRRNSDDHRNRTNRRQARHRERFEAAVAKARPLFLRAKGGKGFELHKSIEKPQRYRLMAQWETLENHTVDFRGSEDFTAWRALVGQYFAAPPEVEHTETVLTTAG
jgi:quinol monooxygenase YgiN